ncbi:glutamate receptor ionotropic, kainate 2-like [Palaemon carinicauda]|uniref:glutamate receptor ionotropic, kainate 2-like n=1 Tax=Palaemon carinicauda TaxID=392227 RepID=UPI0035B58EFA
MFRATKCHDLPRQIRGKKSCKCQDSVKEITRHSTQDAPGIMIFENDGKTSTLEQILTPSPEPPLLLVFCSPQRVLEIFQKIRHHRLESHHANWVIIMEGTEQEVKGVTPQLTKYILEGTRLTLIAKGRGGSLNVSSAEVDTEGRPDGTVTGFIGMVARWEANFAVTTISITDTRATVVDFTFPYYREPLCIFSRTPKQKNRALAILAPFTFLVWICIVISTLAMGPILWLYSKLSLRSSGEENTEVPLRTFSFNVFRNLTNQGNLFITERWPLRILFFFWYIFCLNVSALYSGSLTAVLAIPAYETPIDSLEDLPRAVKDGYTLGVMEDSSHEYVFKEAEDGIYRKTWDLFNHKDRSKSFVNSPKTGINWVLEKDFVYIGPKTITEIIAMKLGIQKFHIGRSLFFTANIAVPCPPGAPYVNTFSQT